MSTTNLIERGEEIRALKGLLGRHPVVGILGARQVGKTTLASQLIASRPSGATIFDLESPSDRARLADPMLALEGLSGLVVLDEIQREPDIFPVLRVLVDRPKSQTRFLVLGSASPDLLRQSAESLAGRIAYHQLGGFSLSELGPQALERLWLRGGFPRSYLARSGAASAEWRRAFIATFLERDIPQFGITIPALTISRFWTMLAHWHGQVWRGSEFARSFGVSEMTVSRYLDLLTSTLVVRRLSPWHENLRKRQVRSPKVYVVDTGLLHSLLSIESSRDLMGHPKVGASWEGFLLEQVIRRLGARPDQCFFWATHAGAELDLLVISGRRRIGFEFKRTSAPQVTPSMRIALSDLGLERIDVLHGGRDTFPLDGHIRAVSAARLVSDVGPRRR